ncbi:MAG TPA: hypothetical protein VFW93_11465 [Aquabacterium sp.]|uniref:hypothetical protein n=1 Tax=Aquabacterium sp. TaxID=1872578 RepID=UPI002E303A34|nr:hypothetical protein [Aquabacterium sp.]HEX5356829.1 hypothetical protein [Aquabacterium sp.]
MHTSTNDVDFNYPGQGGGAGTTPSMSPDSKLAVQGSYKFTPTFSGTAQIMTRYDANSQYVPTVDWLFAKWQVTPALTVRGGRLVAPNFMISDFRNVGYANTTVRPNLDVYGQVPVDQLEGGDVTFQHVLGSTTINATFFAGDANADYTSAFRKGALSIAPSSFQLKKTKGINITAEMDNGLTLRGGYSRSKININSDSIDRLQLSATCLRAISAGSDPCAAVAPFPAGSISGGLAAVLNDMGSQIATAANGLAVQNGNVSFTGFGFSYDQDNWIVSGEYTKRRSDNFVADTTGWYGLVGYRVAKFTPYVGLSRLTVNSANVSFTPVTPLAVNGVTTSVQTSANSGLQGYLDVQKLAQRTITVGTRWDVMPNVALKAQWDQVHKPADSYGLFFTKDPSTAEAQSFLNSRRKVNVLTVSMDFVF